MANQKITVGDFSLVHHDEREPDDDNVKTHHIVSHKGKQLGTLDHSPYEDIDKNTFAKYVKFFQKRGRFPNRKDIDSNGPLSNEDLDKLV